LILGSGNPEIENQLNSLLVDYKGNYNTFIGYRRVSTFNYAGADFINAFKSRACGLNQMYSLRYGSSYCNAEQED
jgi:starch synthase